MQIALGRVIGASRFYKHTARPGRRIGASRASTNILPRWGRRWIGDSPSGGRQSRKRVQTSSEEW